MGDTNWRTEPTPVEMLADELWIAEKFQTNAAIAGSPRNSFRASVGNEFPGGKALNELGGASLLNSIKLRMPEKCLPAVRLRVIKSVVKRVTAQTHS